MPPTLIALAGPLLGETIPLTEESVTVGRELSNRVQPHDLSLSRMHCVLAISCDQVTLTDLDSLNGTFVNSVPVKERVLAHGDHVKIGESVFLFCADETTRPDADTVELDEVAVSHPTVRLRQQDVLYLQSEQMIEAFQPTLRSARNFQVLLRVSAAMASLRSTEELQRKAIELLFEAVPADRVAMLVSDNKGADFTSIFARGRNTNGPVQISHTVVRQVMESGDAILSNDASRGDVIPTTESLVRTGTQSVLCAPMKLPQTVQGALYLSSSERTVRFDEHDLRLVVGIAGLVGLALQNTQHVERLEREAQEMRADLKLHHSLVGESPPMRHLYDLIARSAPSDATVLILGESGTGKELIARAIHENSPRARRPFLAINVAAMAETLLESELFGHERGAFTGAIMQKKGQLELADGGTIFLDEISELALSLQVKLLRVLQEREFTRVGGSRPIKIDVRFLAATNKDLSVAVKDGAFRQDLYYRLNVVVLKVPPLRERRDDIPLLAGFFVNRFSAACKRRVTGLSEEARACLFRHDWPGNVRELENAIERAIVLGSSERLQLDDLPDTILEQNAREGSNPTNYHAAVLDAKRQIVLDALQRTAGNRAEAAHQLGLHPNNLHRLIRNLNVHNTARN